MPVDQNTEALPNAADKERLKTIAPVVVTACPGLKEEAHAVASEILNKHGITGMDPDEVWWHRFDNVSASSNTAFLSWEHAPKPCESLTLTQLVIQGYRVTDQDDALELNSNGGFYTEDANASIFNETNEVRMYPSKVLTDLWEMNLSERYLNKLNAFWATHLDDFRTLAKSNYLSKAVEARQNGQLQEEDFQTVVRAVVGGATWPITLATLQSQTASPADLRICALDVAGHVATDILRIVDRNGRQITYVPGAAQAFHVQPTATDMHWWILLQMNEEQPRTEFMTHFPLSVRKEVHDNITPLMNQLVGTWGKYDHHLINQKNITISGDPFTWQSRAVQSTMLEEADLTLVTHGQMRKQLWLGYLAAGLHVFGPLAVMGWPIALPVIGASIAAMGLNIDKAVNGKTAAQRKAGVIGAVLDGINALFNIPMLKEASVLEEVGASVDAAEAAEMASLRESDSAAESTVTEDPRELDSAESSRPQPEGSPLSPSEPVVVPEQWQCHESLESEMLSAQSGKFQGIYSLHSTPSTAIKMNDAAYYVRFEGDANGAGKWAIIDPENPDAFSGTFPVRLNADGQWELIPRTGLKGGMQSPTTSELGEPSLPQDGAWAQEPGTYVKKLRTPRMREWALGGPDEFITVIEEEGQEVRTSRFAWHQRIARNRLIHDAEAYYEAHPPLPPVQTSSPPPFKTAAELFQTVSEQKSGLVLGQTPGSLAGRKLLIENMPTLAKLGFKRLYLQELLTNANQMDLDTFARTGEMPAELEDYLQKLDLKTGHDPEGKFTSLELVKAANAQHIRVQAVDCAITYNINGHVSLEPQQQMARSFFASEVIQLNEQAHGSANWVALVNRENMSSFRRYQGISEQVGAVSVRIDEVSPGLAEPITADSGAAVVYEDSADTPVYDLQEAPFEGSNTVTSSIKGDWRLQVENPWTYRSSTNLKALLPEPGMYTFQRSDSAVLLVYRNGNKQIEETIIKTMPGGYIELDSPIWPDFVFKPFNNLEALKNALAAKGMRLMGWPAQPSKAVDTVEQVATQNITSEASGTSEVLEKLIPTLPDIEPQASVPEHWQSNEILESQALLATDGKFKGIYSLNSNPSTAILMNDQAYYVRYEADINGGGTWAIIDPATPHASTGSMPVRLNGEGEWELAPNAGLKGGGKNLSKPVPGPSKPTNHVRPTPDFSRHLTRYDAPNGRSLNFLALGKPETHIKVVAAPGGVLRGVSPYEEYVAGRRAVLIRDAIRFQIPKNFFASLPARPIQPVITPSTTVTELIEKVFNTAPGLVIGESQDRIASMRFLIENMPTLAKQGVKTIYMHRLLNDFNQVDLNDFAETGDMHGMLGKYLQKLPGDPAGQFTPLEVVKTAQQNGIRIQATDCLASYRYTDSNFRAISRQSVRTYLTHTIMKATQARNGGGKWVVITDQESTNTFRGMAGISETEGGIGLRIEEVGPDQRQHLDIDHGIEVGREVTEIAPLMGGNVDTLYADISLQIPTQFIQRSPEQINELLFRQGMFTIESSEDTLTLIHRSRTNQIVRTMIARTADGGFLINRPAWTAVHQITYANLINLVHALNRMGLTLEGRLPSVAA